MSRFSVTTFAFGLSMLAAYCQAAEPAIRPLERARARINAQQPADGTARPAVEVTVGKPVVPQETRQSTDAAIASWLAICNQGEVSLGKLAASKAENKEVREFAEQMVKDHGKCLDELEKFGGYANGAERHAAADGKPQLKTHAHQGLDYLGTMRQISQRCLADAQDEWANKKSAECDMAYVGQQYVAHKHMVTTLKVLHEQASPELQKVIAQGIETAESHSDHAKQLIDQLAKAEHKERSSE